MKELLKNHLKDLDASVEEVIQAGEERLDEYLKFPQALLSSSHPSSLCTSSTSLNSPDSAPHFDAQLFCLLAPAEQQLILQPATHQVLSVCQKFRGMHIFLKIFRISGILFIYLIIVIIKCVQSSHWPFEAIRSL